MVKEARWWDRLSLVFSILVVAIAAVVMLQSGMFTSSLAADTQITWHLIRSAGILAYVLLTISMLWGLAVSSRAVSDWSPGVLTMLMHSTISLLAVILSIGHALLLMVDKYFSYTIADVLVPFVGPYRSFAVGLGTLGLWIMVAVSVSFWVKDRMGHRNWWWLHLTSYVTFGLATAHGLLAGTDSERLGIRILLLIGVLSVTGFTAFRVYKARSKPAKPARVAKSA
ncbi:MAG: ferric reductase-like transmembrane domain-containing protein [Anaerolineae bacterium]|nr:ferric reductase-like transmembrane domain-containing protein [Anaerolineae bacterium]